MRNSYGVYTMKKILFTLAAVSLASFSFAQDFGFGDEMGGGDMGSYEEESTPAVTISGEAVLNFIFCNLLLFCSLNFLSS